MADYKALARYVLDCKEWSTTEHRETFQKDWGKYLKYYRNYISDEYVGRAQISIPQTFATTFRLYSAVMSNIRRNKEIGRFIPEPIDDSQSDASLLAAEALNQASSYYTAKGRLLREIAKWELEAVTMGTAFLKTTWDYQEGERPGREVGKEGAQVMEPYVKYDGLRFEHRPLYAIFVDPKAINSGLSVDEMDYIIDQKYVSLSKLFENPKFINRKEVEERLASKKAEPRADTAIQFAKDQIYGTGLQDVETRDEQGDNVLLTSYWGRCPKSLMKKSKRTGYDQKDLKDFMQVHILIVEDIVVFYEENPYPEGKKPYDMIRCYPQTNGFYGIGIPELIAPLQRAVNAVTNQRIDNVGLVMNRMWMFRHNSVNPKHLVSRPGGYIPVRGPLTEALAPIPTPDVTASAYREHDIYDNMIQKVSGVADIFFGHSTKQTRISATEATFLTEMGAGMMEEIVAGQVQDGFVPLMQKINSYIVAFATDPLSVTVDGNTIEVQPSELAGSFELIPTIGEQMFTKTAEMQKAQMLLEITMQVMPVLFQQGKDVNVSRILERIYENAGWKDYASIVRDNQNQQQGSQDPSQALEAGGGQPSGGNGSLNLFGPN